MTDLYAEGIEDPNWSPFTTDGAMTFGHQRHGNAGILTIHGVYDLMHHLGEEAKEEVEKWMREGEDRESMPDWLRNVLPVNEPPPIRVLAEDAPAISWDAHTFQVNPGTVIPISTRTDALRRIVTNLGPGDAFISHDDDISGFQELYPSSWVALPATGLGTPAMAFGTRTSPGAGVQITGAIITPAPGQYTLNWAVQVDGTLAAATDDNNMQLLGGTLFSPYTSENGSVAGTRYPQDPITVTVPLGSTQTIQVKSIVLATVGAVYSAQLSLIPAATSMSAASQRIIRARGRVYAYSVAGSMVDIQSEFGEYAGKNLIR